MTRQQVLLLMIVFCPALCVAQTSYSGLTPGISTRMDAERVLGNPVRTISETLVEYAGREKVLKVYIQYRPNGGTADRIEILFSTVQTADGIFREFGITAEPPATSKISSKGKLEEYYSSNLLVLTYKSSDQGSGVDRVGCYSKSLFEIASKQSSKPVPRGNPPVQSPPMAANYDQVTTDAWNAMLARDFAKALNLLKQATSSNPDQGRAYSYLGVAYLYGYGDLLSTEKSMREALSKNDRATFRVFHDHSGTFQYFCYGWLHIAKSEIQFQSDEGHGFQTKTSEIKEVKLNNLVGANYFAFHIKAGSENYNLAPGSLKLAETNLILKLINEQRSEQ